MTIKNYETIKSETIARIEKLREEVEILESFHLNRKANGETFARFDLRAFEIKHKKSATIGEFWSGKTRVEFYGVPFWFDCQNLEDLEKQVHERKATKAAEIEEELSDLAALPKRYDSAIAEIKKAVSCFSDLETIRKILGFSLLDNLKNVAKFDTHDRKHHRAAILAMFEKADNFSEFSADFKKDLNSVKDEPPKTDYFTNAYKRNETHLYYFKNNYYILIETYSGGRFDKGNTSSTMAKNSAVIVRDGEIRTEQHFQWLSYYEEKTLSRFRDEAKKLFNKSPLSKKYNFDNEAVFISSCGVLHGFYFPNIPDKNFDCIAFLSRGNRPIFVKVAD